MDKHIVLTGGAGFIGSNFARYLLSRGYKVTIIDNFQTSRFSCTQIMYEKLGKSSTDLDMINILPHDFSNGHNIWRVSEYIEAADVVVHLASSVGVKHIDRAPRQTLRNSLDINYSLFPLFHQYNKRVIFASTSEVYGNTKEARETDTLQIGAPDTLRWGYACCKLMSEFLLKSYDIDDTIVRFFNVTGSDQIPTHGMVLPAFIHNAVNGLPLTVYGDGKQYRSFCDVRDACTWLELIMSDQHVNEIYNIGNPANTITILELAKMVIKITNSKSDINIVPYKKEFSSQFGEIFERKPNIEKISKYYKPKYNMNDIISSMI